jgi:glycosyltransferase involved in cell wall biosynthesis
MGLSGVQRIAKFVKYLPDHGWQPTVIATGPTAYYAHDQTLLDELTEREVEIIRTVGKDPNSMMKDLGTVKMPRERFRRLASAVSNTFFIPDNKRGWSKQAIKTAREVIATQHIDMLFVSGPPFSAMMAGAQLSAETGIPLVLDYRDLWLGNQFHRYPTPWHRKKHKKLEHQTLAHAAKVTVTNRKIKERLINTYPHLEFGDVIILPHGFDQEDLQAAQQIDLPFLPNPSDGSTFKITYSGIFYDRITPVPFLKAIKRLRKKRPDMRLELHFAGLLRDEYRKKIHRWKLDGMVVDHGYLPHRETVALLQRSDALWMMVGNLRNAETVSSAKLYEYFGTEKPILACLPDGALRKDAERYGAAWITEPTDVDAIASAISDMYDRWLKGAFPSPDLEFIASFDRKKLTGELARVLSGSLRVI